MSMQRARSRKTGAEERAGLCPQKPEEVRYCIVCLYAAAFIGACFLILNGEVQWHEGHEEALIKMRVALAHMAVGALADAGLAYAISRCRTWARPLLFVCVGTGLIFHALTMADVLALSPGLFLSRLLTLLMELGAIALSLRRPSRQWFARLSG